MSITVQLEDFQVGMELAVPVKNSYNQVLLPANIVLEEKHQKILQTWGITEIRIIEKAGTAAQIKEAEEFYKGKLGARLNWSPRNSHEEELLNVAASYLQSN